jgi:hypothetical protein
MARQLAAFILSLVGKPKILVNKGLLFTGGLFAEK